MIAAVLIVVACAILNRLRGDDSWMPEWLRGRALWYVTPAVAGMAAIIHPWLIALSFGAAYLFWAVWSWGYPLAALGGMTPAREPDRIEALLMQLGSPWAGLARMLFVLPGAALIGWASETTLYIWAALAFAGLATAVYALFLRSAGAFGWARAEIATGGLWGLLIVGGVAL